MKKRKPRNLAEQDGLMWRSRAGRLWGDYQTCAEYMGIAPNSFAAYVWRHSIKTIKSGRKTLASKDDLDKKSGAAQDDSNVTSNQLPLRKLRKSG